MSEFASLEAEYVALTSGPGFVELEDWTTISITGDDRVSFLHNMCTNDIKKLTAGESCEAFCTDVKGKIVAQVLVSAHDDRLVLLSVPEQAETVIAHLDRYVIREDVQLTEESDQHCWFIAGAGDCLPDELGTHGTLINLLTWGGSKLLCVQNERKDAKQLLTDYGMAACDKSAWETRRIEQGLPLFSIDFDNSNLPQEVNRDDEAISFNKGCYLGQETIARIDALGHVNQKIVAIKFDGKTVPQAGDELKHDDKVVGRVTSSCWSFREEAPLALAMVRRGANDEGTQLQSEVGQATVLSGD